LVLGSDDLGHEFLDQPLAAISAPGIRLIRQLGAALIGAGISRGVHRLVDDTIRTLAELAANHVSAELADGAAATCCDETEGELFIGGDAARCQATKAKELQELLGDHHDRVVARAVLLKLAARARTAGQDTSPMA
jgi:hypothetical protein